MPKDSFALSYSRHIKIVFSLLVLAAIILAFTTFLIISNVNQQTLLTFFILCFSILMIALLFLPQENFFLLNANDSKIDLFELAKNLADTIEKPAFLVNRQGDILYTNHSCKFLEYKKLFDFLKSFSVQEHFIYTTLKALYQNKKSQLYLKDGQQFTIFPTNDYGICILNFEDDFPIAENKPSIEIKNILPIAQLQVNLDGSILSHNKIFEDFFDGVDLDKLKSQLQTQLQFFQSKKTPKSNFYESYFTFKHHRQHFSFRMLECYTSLPHHVEILLYPIENIEFSEDMSGRDFLFSRVFNGTPIGIALTDYDGKLTEVNPAFQRMTGQGYVVGKSLLSMVDKNDYHFLQDAIEKKQIIQSQEIQLLDKTDSHAKMRSVEVMLSHLNSYDQKALIFYFIDLSEQKNLELKFAQSQKMQAIGQLAGGIAHDFNNLLTAIIGHCDLLLTRHDPSDPDFADIKQVEQNANRAAALVGQLLAFSRQQTLRPEILQITDMLEEVSHLLKRLLGEKIELKLIHARQLGLVRVDKGQFTQVIMNLVVNARDAIEEQGSVIIETKNIDVKDCDSLGYSHIMPANNYIMIRVSDTGSGIPKELLVKIFEPFFTTKDVGKGTGLGLSTVYGIIKQTGGFIFVDSEKDKGTHFEIYLPRLEDEKPIEQNNEITLQKNDVKTFTGQGTIILVEDEPAVRSFAVRALKSRGYKVLEADNGEDALDLIKNHQGEINLMVSDVVMPGMDGPTLLTEIRKIKPDLKVIFMSGYAEDAFKKNLQEGEQFHFIPKPFSLKQLIEKVKTVLEIVH